VKDLAVLGGRIGALEWKQVRKLLGARKVNAKEKGKFSGLHPTIRLTAMAREGNRSLAPKKQGSSDKKRKGFTLLGNLAWYLPLALSQVRVSADNKSLRF
jgi:hypothetical protein